MGFLGKDGVASVKSLIKSSYWRNWKKGFWPQQLSKTSLKPAVLQRLFVAVLATHILSCLPKANLTTILILINTKWWNTSFHPSNYTPQHQSQVIIFPRCQNSEQLVIKEKQIHPPTNPNPSHLPTNLSKTRLWSAADQETVRASRGAGSAVALTDTLAPSGHKTSQKNCNLWKDSDGILVFPVMRKRNNRRNHVEKNSYYLGLFF